MSDAVRKLSMVLVVALLVGAVGVRGIEREIGIEPPVPVDDLDSDLVPQPLQLLRPHAQRRLEELEDLISPALRRSYAAALDGLAALEDCPELHEWMQTSEGQKLERLLTELDKGTREDALGALGLIFRLARVCEWNPGYFGGSQGAERLGGLLREWLGVWAERSVKDPLLFDPALAAAIVYGKAMRTAYRGNLFSDNDASRERARGFLERLLGAQGESRTSFAMALAQRYPGALAGDAGGDDFLEGFDQEVRLAFPELDGECD